jgi:hypothetical protein
VPESENLFFFVMERSALSAVNADRTKPLGNTYGRRVHQPNDSRKKYLMASNYFKVGPETVAFNDADRDSIRLAFEQATSIARHQDQEKPIQDRRGLQRITVWKRLPHPWDTIRYTEE